MHKYWFLQGGGASCNRKNREAVCFLINKCKNKAIFKRGAFSVAEAMMTLLIVSVALAASAPLISRQMKHSITNQLPAQAAIPTGAVMFFNLPNCPDGWTNATTLGWGGRFFRVADAANPRNVPQEDTLRAHNHAFAGFGITWIGQGGGCPSGTCNALTQNTAGGGGTTAETGEGETRPQNIPLTTCVKD